MDIYDYLRDAITPEIKSLREDLEDFERETNSLAAMVESQRKEAADRALGIDNKIVENIAKAMNVRLAGKWIVLQGDRDFVHVNGVSAGTDNRFKQNVIKIDSDCTYTIRHFNPFNGYNTLYQRYAQADLSIPIVNGEAIYKIREATPAETADVLIHRAWIDSGKPEFKCEVGDRFILRLENVRDILMVGEGSTTARGYTITCDEYNIYLDEKGKCICGDCECVVKAIKTDQHNIPYVVLRTTDMDKDEDNDNFSLNYGECALMLVPKA